MPSPLADLVGADEERLREREIERLGGLEVHHEIEFLGLLDREVFGPGAAQYLGYQSGKLSVGELKARCVANETAILGSFRPFWRRFSVAPSCAVIDSAGIRRRPVCCPNASISATKDIPYFELAGRTSSAHSTSIRISGAGMSDKDSAPLAPMTTPGGTGGGPASSVVSRHFTIFPVLRRK
jgi:hypothetical protein